MAPHVLFWRYAGSCIAARRSFCHSVCSADAAGDYCLLPGICLSAASAGKAPDACNRYSAGHYCAQHAGIWLAGTVTVRPGADKPDLVPVWGSADCHPYGSGVDCDLLPVLCGNTVCVLEPLPG